MADPELARGGGGGGGGALSSENSITDYLILVFGIPLEPPEKNVGFAPAV